MIVPAQRIGEALRDGRLVALFPEADDDQLISVPAADEHQVAVAQIPDQDRAPLAVHHPSGGVRPGDPRRDLGALLQRTADPLPVALGRMMCDDDDQSADTAAVCAPLRYSES